MNERRRTHRYQIGQKVKFARGFGFTPAGNASYEVVALLPSDGSHFQYRVKFDEENFERIASENQLLLRQENYVEEGR